MTHSGNDFVEASKLSDRKPICPLCSGTKITDTGKPQLCARAKDIVNVDYHIMRCQSCKFYFVFPTIDLTPEQWSVLYGPGYFTEMTDWWAEKRAQYRRERLHKIQSFSLVSSPRFLDVGCGEGYVLLDALDAGWDVHGQDVQDYRMDRAKNENIKFHVGDIISASYPENHFDIIYADSVLEHVVDFATFMAEIRQITRPGGLVYFGVPNEESLFNYARKLYYLFTGKSHLSCHIKPFSPPFHVIGFSKCSLFKMMINNGFEILYFHNFGGEYEWRKHRLFSRGFILNFGLIPMHFIAYATNRRTYFEVIIRKSQ